MVRAFDDADVIHVEGDVNPTRDMEIIQTELRLKDIEWVEKHLDGLKRTGRALGNNSLADKAKKEEIVSTMSYIAHFVLLTLGYKATIEKIYKTLTEDQKDVRKADWTNKEVSFALFLTESVFSFLLVLYCDEKERKARINPAR